MIFGPRNWYWALTDTPNSVWSSAANAFVSVNDQTFQAWLASGGELKLVANAIELVSTLQTVLPDVPITDPTLTDALKSGQATAIITNAIFKVMFNHENRIRAIERNLGLNGSPPNMTPAQAFAAVKALL